MNKQIYCRQSNEIKECWNVDKQTYFGCKRPCLEGSAGIMIKGKVVQ